MLHAFICVKTFADDLACRADERRAYMGIRGGQRDTLSRQFQCSAHEALIIARWHDYAKRDSTKDCESKGRRSPVFSPTPTYRTGNPSSREMATTTPPFAVPSSFVSTIPVTPAD